MEALRLVTSGLREFTNSIGSSNALLDTISPKQQLPGRGTNKPVSKPIREGTSYGMMMGAAVGAGGAMFAPPELLITICAALLYCGVYFALLSTAAHMPSASRQQHEIGTFVTVAAVLMLSGMQVLLVAISLLLSDSLSHSFFHLLSHSCLLST